MKINKLKINNYGKLKDKEINFEPNLNIIYGKNEAGKSTLLNFIINSFYGISKNKKGKEISDTEKYTPWVGEEFSGKLEYQLDNNETFEIFRDFKKKNPKVFNQNKEDISKQFNIDKNKGNEFFYEQTQISEDMFLATSVAMQQEVKIGKNEQNILIQKISNLLETGEDNISYKKAVDKLNKMQLDKIWTERSREKPINIIKKNIYNIEAEKQELEKYKDFKYEIEENKNNYSEKINKLENKNNYLKEIKLLNENEKIKKEKIKIKEDIKKENIEKINLLKNKINEIKNNNKNILINKDKKSEKNNNKNKLNKKIILFFILIIILNIIQFILIKNKLINYILFLTVPMDLIFSIFLKIKENKKIKKKEKIEKNRTNEIEKINLDINNIENQVKLLEKNNLELENNINELKNNFYLKINLEKEKINNKYKNKIEKNELINLNNIKNINYEILEIENEINNKKIKLHTLDLDKKNIEPKLENLSKLEENIVDNKEKMLTLKKLEKSIMLAKEILDDSYQEMKNTVTPKFTQNLSKNISTITDGKYNNIQFDDQKGLIVELENGNYISASQLSIGTIDQLYLSLRLSMVEELSEEKMPIILDESFAYYDTERLENILKYNNNKYIDHQIIILTCTNREKEILEKLNIKFNLISL